MPDAYGDSPLHHVIKLYLDKYNNRHACTQAVVKHLLEAGENPLLRDGCGNQATKILHSKRDRALIEIVKDHIRVQQGRLLLPVQGYTLPVHCIL